MLKHLILPSVTLGLLICGVFIRLVRVNILQTMQSDYVEAAEARGITQRKVTGKHAFRNALVPVITVIGLQFALLLGGAVLTEKTFNWPGIGSEAGRTTSTTATTAPSRASSRSSPSWWSSSACWSTSSTRSSTRE